jgi:hypothetical protein
MVLDGVRITKERQSQAEDAYLFLTFMYCFTPFVSMYVCMYEGDFPAFRIFSVCMYVCMYVCMNVFIVLYAGATARSVGALLEKVYRRSVTSSPSSIAAGKQLPDTHTYAPNM